MLSHQPIDKQQTAAQTALSAHSRRPAGERSPGPQGVSTGEGIIQAKTMIHYSPGRYDYQFDPTEGKFRKSVTVGREMHAELDPDDPKHGSSTGSGGTVHKDLINYLGRKWDQSSHIIRGHLLNDHLGGLSVEENLFPISKLANSWHLHQFEKYVKHYVYTGSKKYGLIEYDVSSKNEDNTQQFDEFHPRTKFECSLTVYGREEADSAREGSGDTFKTTIWSDISNNSAGGSAPAFGERDPWSGNTSKQWGPGNTKLDSRQDNGQDDAVGNGYKLRREGTRDSLGTVAYETGSYIASEKWDPDAYIDRKKGWGHDAYRIYSALGAYLAGNAERALHARDMYEEAAQIVEEALNGSGWEKVQAVRDGVSSLYILDLRKAAQAGQNDVEVNANDVFARDKDEIIGIILGHDGIEAQSKEALMPEWGREGEASVNHYLEILYRNGIREIGNAVQTEIQTKIIPYICEKNHPDWVRAVEVIVLRGRKEGQWNWLNGAIQSIIVNTPRNGSLGGVCPYTYLVAVRGEQSNLYSKILVPVIDSALGTTISKVQQGFSAKLKEIGLKKEAHENIWAMMAAGMGRSEIADALSGDETISPEEEGLFLEIYNTLPEKMITESGELQGHADIDNVVRKYFDDETKNKYMMLRNVVFKVFYDYLERYKEETLAMFYRDGLSIGRLTEEIMAVLGVDEKNSFSLGDLLKTQIPEENMRNWINTTPADYDWMDLSPQSDRAANQKGYDREGMENILLNCGFNPSYIREIVSNVLCRWVLEADQKKEDPEEYEPAYEE